MASRIRISGLVALARRAQQELSGHVSPAQLEALRRSVREAVEVTQGALAQAGLDLSALPLPSRKAYEFLIGIDFGGVRTTAEAPATDAAAGSVRFPGLSAWFDGLLARLSQAQDDGPRRALHEEICGTSRNLEREIQAAGMRPEHLTAESRAILAWLSYFARGENFAACLRAQAVAKAAFEEAAARQGGWPLPVVVQFRPMKGLYRLRRCEHATRVQLPTPMISFDAGLLRQLADLAILKRGTTRAIFEAMTAPAYLAVAAEVEPDDGVRRSAGIHHSLAAAFDRVNAAYFGGSMPRPLLEWSRTFTASKFGHYDGVRDAVRVSSSLDRRNVPECVVDFIVYHELVHKRLGIRWEGDRKAVHTPAFLAEEKRFARYAEAKAFLNAEARAAGPKPAADAK